MINVFYGEKTIKISKDSNFRELKKKIFFGDKKLIKYFSYAGKKIEEWMFVSDYPKFTIVMDQGEYQEFAKGKFRCKKCRNYVKLSKMICIHSSKCRIFYNFKLKEPMTNKLDGGYFEFEKENYERENNEIEDEIYEEKIV